MTPAEFRPNGIVALLTDFGVRDPFVGVMKGVILGIFPHARLIDLTHEVEPQDVRAGAFALEGAWRYFPEGTVFVSIVDPGVGTGRSVVFGLRDGRLFLGPDNGILSYVLRAEDPVWRLDVDRFSLPQRSSTFHGRDIFAPAAARLAQGYPPEHAGERGSSIVRLTMPRPRLDRDGSLLGEVLTIDRFGNLTSTITREDLRAFAGVHLSNLAVTVAKKPIGSLKQHYAEGVQGQPIALVNSLGHLEIAIRDGSAAKELDLQIGAEVRVQRRSA